MPDMIQPVGAMIKPQDPMQGINTMSGILGLQQQRQALTQGQQQIQATGMANTGTAMSLGERQRVQQILSSGVDDQGNSIKDADGTPDPDKAMKWMPRVAPTTYPTYLKGIQETEANKLGLKSTTADLGQKYRDQIGGMLQSGVNDPSFNSQKAAALLVPYGAQNPEAAPAISHALSLLKHLDSVNSGDPKADLAKKNDMLVHTIQAFKPSQSNQPVTVDTGPAIQPGSQQPLTGAITPTGAPIAKGIAPSIVPTPAGPLARVGGNGSTLTPLTTAGPPGQAPPSNLNVTTAQATTQNTAAAGVANRVQQAQAAANNTSQAQDALTRARGILDKPDAINSGAGFEWKKMARNVLASAGIATSEADDANTLVKNLARYEASRATQAGLGGTDAARELAHNGSPNAALSTDALKGVITQSLATEKALAAYANIQSKTRDAGQLAKNEADFRSIPNLIQAYEYGLARNPHEAEEFLKKHGLTRAEMTAARQKIREFEGR
jgi:hypothetical protein